jgi:hypothetical protein
MAFTGDAEATKILKRDALERVTRNCELCERLHDEFERSGRHTGECHGAISEPTLKAAKLHRIRRSQSKTLR